MSTLGQSLGMHGDARSWKASDKMACNDTFVGVEIELEGMQAFGGHYVSLMQDKGLWQIVRDGSLRDHGLEFIMSTASGEPMKGADIVRALGVFKRTMSEYKGAGYTPACTPRTSIHVHVDVRDLEFEHLKKFVLLYAVFEDIFFQWADPERRTNNYCRSIDCHHDVFQRMSQLLAADDNREGVAQSVGNGNKYDAVNLLSIAQRGSMEFRLMRGTYDTKLILEWINILLAMRKAAQDRAIVIDGFPEDMSQRGIPNLIDQVFGEWGSSLKEFATDIDILEGVRRAQDILLYQTTITLDQQFSQHSPKTTSHLKAFHTKLQEA